MTGITNFGAYIPFLRISRKQIANAWGGRAGDGERAVAGVDEDSITMAVEAVRDLLASQPDHVDAIDGLIFASTTSPYSEKQAAALIATAADLRPDIRTTDNTNSLRAGTGAIRSALDSVSAGSASNIIIVAADTRLGQPKSASERSFGDAASALQVGRDNVTARLLADHSVADEITDVWRSSDDRFTTGWEERFAVTQGYQKVVRQTVSELFERTGIGPSQIAKAIFFAPDQGSLTAVAKGLGFNAGQIPDHMLATVGSTGAAMPLLVLSSALEQASPGDKLLVVGYGSGCDALLFEATDEIRSVQGSARLGTGGHIASKGYVANYEQYARFRNLIETEPPRRQAEAGSAAQTWRDREEIYRFHGQRCISCGVVQYPRQRVCIRCQSKDNFESVKLAGKKGVLFTYTVDYLNADPNPPTVMTIVDFEGGGRAYLMMTDRDPDKVAIGQSVEITFRRLYEADGFKNYYWKCRPPR